jgi:hypothetical protein
VPGSGTEVVTDQRIEDRTVLPDVTDLAGKP